MPALMEKFPGQISVEAQTLDSSMPRVAECGPILRLVASQRRTAVPYVLALVDDDDPEKRFWATYLMTELVYPDAVDAALRRVFDDDARVRRAARLAARALAEAHPSAVVDRLSPTVLDKIGKKDHRMIAIDTLGETRTPLAVLALVPVLSDKSSEIAAAARAALTTITRQDFGTDSKKWEVWWAENKDRHRLEWLIDALTSEQAVLRSAAGEELKAITKEFFGYHDDLPKKEREKAQARYREWWAEIGRVRFSRASSSRGG
jgi:HEAT repeat protein